jgi:hypothetical protein
MKLTREMLDKIQSAAEGMEYGSILIKFVGHLDTVDIEVMEATRFKKGEHRPGEIVAKHGRGA